MKRAVIIHCWGGYPEYCWYPSVKAELERNGFEVQVPVMPDTDKPKLIEWLPTLQKVAGEPDENLFLIGHSLGCATIMRYLESLTSGEKIGGVVFVAGFDDGLDAEKYPEVQNFFTTPFDYEKIKSRCDKFVAIASDDDPYVPLRYADILKERFGAEVTIKHSMKHFSGAADGEENCVQLPEVVESMLKLAKQKMGRAGCKPDRRGGGAKKYPQPSFQLSLPPS